MKVNTTSPVVSIGIDAAVVAAHQIAVRGEVREDFKTPPTLAGLATLTNGSNPTGGRWWWPNQPRGPGCRWPTP